ncbi:hypothetical protein [Sphingomonas solaris]|uniref:DUF1097 domain-containing protein n=1 Tax=Alterirhizorhabdus solaris TaxID=2529389 RepID=A0A558R1X8_9SPHN|nr:hypothetical protein [Sphingomonas solaris]TVV73383.1 hypothetical protein FOY91_12310 [Sphingomonas solaris]
MSNGPEDAHARLSVPMTAVVLVGVFVFMGLFFALHTLLGVGMPVFGILFLIYWAAILKQDPAAFVPSVLGPLAGIALAWVLIVMPAQTGTAGMVVSRVILVVVLFCFTRGQAKLLVNNATMLFVTVAAVPEFDVGRNYGGMAGSVVLSAAYMGLVALGLREIGKRRANRKIVADVA